MSLEKVNLGIVGMGQHADLHLPHLKDDPDCVISIMADNNRTHLAEARRDYAPLAKITPAENDVYSDLDVDAVYLMNPTDWHTYSLIEAVQHGKHAFVELPLAQDPHHLEICRDALYVAEMRGLIVATCYPRRLDQAYRNTKLLLDEREQLSAVFGLPANANLGPVANLAIKYSYPQDTPHFAADYLPHEIDTTMYLLGFSGLKQAICRQRSESTFRVKAQRDDGIGLNLIGKCSNTQNLRQEKLGIRFEDSSILVVNTSTGELTLKHDGLFSHEKPLGDDEQPLFKTDTVTPFAEINRNFINGVKNPANYQPLLSEQEMFMGTVASLALSHIHEPVRISTDTKVTPLNSTEI